MPASISPGVVGERESLSDRILSIKPQDALLVSLIPKGNAPTAYIHQYQGELPRDPDKEGVKNRQPVGAFRDHTVRRMFEMNSHMIREGWEVGIKDMVLTRVAGIDPGTGASKAQKAKKMADALLTARRGVTQVLGDDEDQRDEGEKGSETRGLGSSISTAAQDLRPIPEEFRPGADQIYTGAFADFYEDDLIALVCACSTRANKVMRYAAPVGLELRRKFGGFSIRQPVQSGEAAVRYFNQDRADRVLQSVVDLLVTDGGEVELHTCFDLAVPRRGAYTLGTTQSRRGYIIPLEDGHWEMGEAMPLQNIPNKDDASGADGVIQGMFNFNIIPICMGKIAPGS